MRAPSRHRFKKSGCGGVYRLLNGFDSLVVEDTTQALGLPPKETFHMKWQLKCQGLVAMAVAVAFSSASLVAAEPVHWSPASHQSAHSHVWQEVAAGAQVYQIGSCDFTPPCVDHLWSGYSQNPHRCNMHGHHGCGNRYGLGNCAGSCGIGYGGFCGKSHGCTSCGSPACGTPACGTVVPSCSTPTEAPVPVPSPEAADTSARRTPAVNRYQSIPASYIPTVR